MIYFLMISEYYASRIIYPIYAFLVERKHIKTEVYQFSIEMTILSNTKCSITMNLKGAIIDLLTKLMGTTVRLKHEPYKDGINLVLLLIYFV